MNINIDISSLRGCSWNSPCHTPVCDTGTIPRNLLIWHSHQPYYWSTSLQRRSFDVEIIKHTTPRRQAYIMCSTVCHPKPLKDLKPPLTSPPSARPHSVPKNPIPLKITINALLLEDYTPATVIGLERGGRELDLSLKHKKALSLFLHQWLVHDFLQGFQVFSLGYLHKD